MTNTALSPAGLVRSWKRLALLALVLVTLISFAPLISLVLAGTAASLLGCQVDEGSVHPCAVGGVDIGEMLNTSMVLGWLMFVTWPGVLVSLGLWAVVVARWISRRMRG
ncbi:hypothetical protein [Beijerinckia sp. L45]|uniref:hypothetical protein n=1 Tax=Beijerinckia sp. L45 TaxID=1641855 RepID=UPI00131E925D|nr:hypothetical protein [Beijerinckia sp. L45]